MNKTTFDSLLADMRKYAAELITGKRQTAPVHSMVDQIVFDEQELKPPTTADYANWRGIIGNMERARPVQLADAKVLSGRVGPRHIINSIAARAGEDTFFERLRGDRSMLSQAYAGLTPSNIEQEDASYHPHANAVILNNSSPGALIHELGHAIDLSRGSGESKFRRSLRWNYKPTLLKEYAAWSKGRRAYREGFADETNSSVDKVKDRAELVNAFSTYLDNMQSVHNRKYPAFGTYAGGTVGAVGGGLLGGAAGIAAMLAARDSDSTSRSLARLVPLGVLAGSALGGASGLFGGGLLGKMYANMRSGGVRERETNKLLKLLQAPNDPEIRKQLLASIYEARDRNKNKDKRVV